MQQQQNQSFIERRRSQMDRRQHSPFTKSARVHSLTKNLPNPDHGVFLELNGTEGFVVYMGEGHKWEVEGIDLSSGGTCVFAVLPEKNKLFLFKELAFCAETNDNSPTVEGKALAETLELRTDKMTNFNELSTKELVNAYNAMAKEMDDNLVIRFSDRKTGIRRCEKMAEKYAEYEKEVIGDAPVVEPTDNLSSEMRNYGMEECPSCGVHLSNGVLDMKQHLEDLKSGDLSFLGTDKPVSEMIAEHRAETTHEFECMGCGHQFGKELSLEVDANRSAAIAKSWEDEEVKAKRSQRHAVRVSGGDLKGTNEYRSVRQAFVALNLPLSKHIKFRMELKAAGQLNSAFGYDWEVIEA